MTLVTVVSGPEQPRRWATSEKLRIVEESLAAEQHEAERSDAARIERRAGGNAGKLARTRWS
jgi:hypothetical protein